MIISDNAGNVTVTPSDFPSPCKVNRCISVFEWILEQSGLLFPSPLEVNRVISLLAEKPDQAKKYVPVPSRGW